VRSGVIAEAKLQKPKRLITANKFHLYNDKSRYEEAHPHSQILDGERPRTQCPPNKNGEGGKPATKLAGSAAEPWIAHATMLASGCEVVACRFALANNNFSTE
jgi:hypothetical protein